MNDLDTAKQIQDLYTNYYDFSTDPFKWDQMPTAVQELVNNQDVIDSLSQEQLDLLNQYRNNFAEGLKDPTFKQLILNLFSGNSTIAQQYRTRYKDAVEQKYKDYVNRANLLQHQASIYENTKPKYHTNQWGLSFNSAPRTSVLYQKKGGSIRDSVVYYKKAVLEDRRKASKQAIDNLHKRQKQINDNLNKALDRLTKEELLLLRAAFK